MDPAPAQPTVSISSLLCNATDQLEDPITNAKNKVRYALDDLQATGMLHSKNRMDIEALLNPANESQMMDETIDEEICKAVLAAKKSQEEGPINGRDDNDNDNTPLEPCPTHHKVFQAASIINRYTEHLDDPLTCKLEAILGSFGCQMCLEKSWLMTSTYLTDYFHCT
jgi:hypothetical protein